MSTRDTTSPADGRNSLPDAWVVRAERAGLDEDFNFREGVASIHWERFPDPFTHDKAALEQYAETLPHDKDKHRSDAPRQIWDFAHNIPIGALIVTPRLSKDHRGEVAVGWCRGSAYHVDGAPDSVPDLRLPVEWVRTDAPRADFDAATQLRFNVPHHTVSPIRSAAVVTDILRRLSLTAPD